MLRGFAVYHEETLLADVAHHLDRLGLVTLRVFNLMRLNDLAIRQVPYTEPSHICARHEVRASLVEVDCVDEAVPANILVKAILAVKDKVFVGAQEALLINIKDGEAHVTRDCQVTILCGRARHKYALDLAVVVDRVGSLRLIYAALRVLRLFVDWLACTLLHVGRVNRLFHPEPAEADVNLRQVLGTFKQHSVVVRFDTFLALHERLNLLVDADEKEFAGAVTNHDDLIIFGED